MLCGFPEDGSFGEVSGRVEFSVNRTDYLFRSCFIGSIQSCVCQTGWVLPTGIPIFDVLCTECRLWGISDFRQKSISYYWLSPTTIAHLLFSGSSLTTVVHLQQLKTPYILWGLPRSFWTTMMDDFSRVTAVTTWPLTLLESYRYDGNMLWGRNSFQCLQYHNSPLEFHPVEWVGRRGLEFSQ